VARLVEHDTAPLRAIPILEFNFLGELCGLGVRLFRQAKAWTPTESRILVLFPRCAFCILPSMLAAFITTILFSLSAICGQRLTRHVSGTEANLARLIFVFVVLGAATCLFSPQLSAAVFPYLFISGCIGFGVGDLSMFQAYPRIGTRRTMVLIQCLAAPFAALAEWIWLRHAPTLAQAGFGALILAGVGIALMPRKTEAQPTHGLAAGICFGVLAALCQAGGAVMSRKAYEVSAHSGHALHDIRDGIGVAFQRVLGGLLITTLFFLYLKVAHKPFTTRKAEWKTAWPWLIGGGLAGPALGVTCFQWALMTEKTSIVMPIVATTPLMVMPLAHFLEGDRITWRTVLGGVIAVTGVIGLTLAK
jgi:drug/metabolite transporter (DMT)-like permease